MRYPTADITATGGTVTTDGSDTIHSFTSDGNFVISSGTGTVQHLIIGGGGSGGSSASNGAGMGGGGAGGVIQGTATMSSGTYPVVVGTGGVQTNIGTGNNNPPDQCSNQYYSTGDKGTSSTFNGLEAYGGGAGYGNGDSACLGSATEWEYDGDIRDGGSGGGGAFDNNGGNDALLVGERTCKGQVEPNKSKA